MDLTDPMARGRESGSTSRPNPQSKPIRRRNRMIHSCLEVSGNLHASSSHGPGITAALVNDSSLWPPFTTASYCRGISATTIVNLQHPVQKTQIKMQQDVAGMHQLRQRLAGLPVHRASPR